MNPVLQTKISIRSQAILILAGVGIWYGSVVGCICEIESKKWFWAYLLILLPFIIAVFATILVWTYQRSDKSESRWFYAGLAAAASCWALIVCYFTLIGFL